jgi:hypothetical protein
MRFVVKGNAKQGAEAMASVQAAGSVGGKNVWRDVEATAVVRGRNLFVSRSVVSNVLKTGIARRAIYAKMTSAVRGGWGKRKRKKEKS